MNSNNAEEKNMEKFDLSRHQREAVEKENLSLWIPKDRKEKYALIQGASNQEFSKYLQKIVIAAIDAVDLDQGA
jgi:hypothetical protein